VVQTHSPDRKGLANDLWSVIAAEVTFATPYAIFIFQQYGVSIPIELDEAARIDGASPIQVYLHIYLPLMAPALVAVGTYALLLAAMRRRDFIKALGFRPCTRRRRLRACILRSSILEKRMSQMGHSRHFLRVASTSALPPIPRLVAAS
jgi:hypothetical protein